MMVKLKRVTGPVFFLLGCFILYSSLKKFGFEQILTGVTSLGYWICFVLVFPLTWYFCQTLAWWFVMAETANHVSLLQLLKIKLAGEAVNTMTPVSFMGGDPVRIYLLKKRMPGLLAAASTVLDRTMQSAAVILFLFVGLGLAWVSIELPPLWKQLFPLLTLLMVGLVWFFIHHQQKGVFEFLSRALPKLGLKGHLTEAVGEKITALDGRIARFYQESRLRFLLVLGLHFLARVLGVIEIWLIAIFLGINLDFLGAFFLTSLSVMVNFTFIFIPGSMGVMEGAYGVLCELMGLPGFNGVAIQLVRRVRALFWILVGTLLMFIYNRLYARETLSRETLSRETWSRETL